MASSAKTAPKPAAKKPAAKPAARNSAAKKPAPAKPVEKAKPAPKGKPEAKPAPKKKADAPASEKVVRDGFTMPQADYDKLKNLKALCLKNGVEVKKSTLLRAGLKALESLPAAGLLTLIASLAPIKAGRKKKKD
jgi:type IV secretory pathway VirB10-like protein